DEAAQSREDGAEPDPRNKRVVICPQHPAALAVGIAERQIEGCETIGGNRSIRGLAACHRILATLRVEGQCRATGPLDNDLGALDMIVRNLALGDADKAQPTPRDLQTLAGMHRLDPLAAPRGRDDDPGDQHADTEMGERIAPGAARQIAEPTPGCAERLL